MFFSRKIFGKSIACNNLEDTKCAKRTLGHEQRFPGRMLTVSFGSYYLLHKPPQEREELRKEWASLQAEFSQKIEGQNLPSWKIKLFLKPASQGSRVLKLRCGHQIQTKLRVQV